MEEKTTYLVMETHPAYVILLDSEGRFLKAANYGYERGERIHTAVLFPLPLSYGLTAHNFVFPYSFTSFLLKSN